MKIKYTYAIVKKPGQNFNQAISSYDESKNIDLEKALYQHDQYCKALEKVGLTLIKLSSEDKYPDSCFVQDPFVTFGNIAMQTIQKAKTRKGESKSIHEVIKFFKKVVYMKSPGFMDGGDVMFTPYKIFIGNSKRTNLEAIKQFKINFRKEKIPEVIAVPVTKCLHLMTGVSYIGKNTLLISDLVEKKYFKGFKKIYVPNEENYAVNCLSFNDTVIVPKGYKHTLKQIKKSGFETVELEMSEFKKADGGLTCLSQLF